MDISVGVNIGIVININIKAGVLIKAVYRY